MIVSPVSIVCLLEFGQADDNGGDRRGVQEGNLDDLLRAVAAIRLVRLSTRKC